MKLPDRTPEPVIFFLAGTRPLPAHLHLRKLSLFGMICRLQGNVLHSIGRIMLTDCKPAAKTWFQDIRDICVQYALPHPLDLLNNPPPKLHFKKLCKEQVHLYWREKLTSMSDIPSLKFLITPFLSLLKPHPIWTSLDGNPYQAKAAKVQALFLSGRYRTERLCRFWSSNSNGYCLLDSCLNLKYFDDYSHILLHCSGLIDERRLSETPKLSVLHSRHKYSQTDIFCRNILKHKRNNLYNLGSTSNITEIGESVCSRKFS